MMNKMVAVLFVESRGTYFRLDDDVDPCEQRQVYLFDCFTLLCCTHTKLGE
jgi:hypothetical protein